MKSFTAFSLVAFCATLAAASPLDKRALVTEIEMHIVTVTVTGWPPADTPAPTAEPTSDDSDRNGWGNWAGWQGGSWNSESSAPAPAPAPTTTPAAPVAPTAAAVETPAPSSEAPWPTPASDSAPPAQDSASGPPSPPNSAPQRPPAAASHPPAPVSTSVSSDYQQGILDSHNIHRANASVPDLTWDDHMASIAAQIAASCVYAHNTAAGGGGYGQNIGAGADPSGVAAMITDEMYNDEIGFYPGYGSEPDMSNFESWGHYSQIVWKSTTGVGCATQHCPNGLANTGGNVSPYFTVCNYSPPGTFLTLSLSPHTFSADPSSAGNFGGQYGANVLQPGNMPTVNL